MPRFGSFISLGPPPTKGAKAVELALGWQQATPPQNIPFGASPQPRNYIFREGAAEPRHRVGDLSSANILNDDVLWLGEYSTTTGGRFAVAISARTLAWYSNRSWRRSNYSSTPINDPLSGNDTNYIDAVVFYNPTLDENNLCFVNDVDQAFAFDGPSANTFSTLTNAPIAKTVAVFDSRLVFGNITSGATRFPQRVVWSARGDPVTYSEPTGGLEELLDARGNIQHVVGEADRLLVFTEFEIWQGFRTDFPFDLQFVPLDRTVGTMAPWSVVQTPLGVVFLGTDKRVYLIQPGSLPRAISQQVAPELRDNIDFPERAAAEYSAALGKYVLGYPVQGGTGRCDRALAFDILTGTWEPYDFGYGITRFGNAELSSSGTTFGGLIGTFAQQTLTYGQLAGTSQGQVFMAGTSTGSVGQFTSSATGDFTQRVESRLPVLVPNENPTQRLFLRELRLDYRAISASSLTIRISNDFGASYQQSIGVALPLATLSEQTTVPLAASANYPWVEFQHDQGHRFALQRATILVETLGNG